MNPPTAISGSPPFISDKTGPEPRDGQAATPGSGSRENRIQDLVRQIESFPDGRARTLLQECVESVLALYGDGLARILQLASNAGAEGEKVRDAFIQDKLVRSLLLVHGLHPHSLETRLHGALARIRPYLEGHGGNVELIRLENDVATLRLQGTCKTCPSSTVTLELAVRQALEQDCPDLRGFEVEGVQEPIQPPAPLACDQKIFAK